MAEEQLEVLSWLVLIRELGKGRLAMERSPLGVARYTLEITIVLAEVDLQA